MTTAGTIHLGDWVDNTQTIHVTPKHRLYKVTEIDAHAGRITRVGVQPHDLDQRPTVGGWHGIWGQHIALVECPHAVSLPARDPQPVDAGQQLDLFGGAA